LPSVMVGDSAGIRIGVGMVVASNGVGRHRDRVRLVLSGVSGGRGARRRRGAQVST
jgi:hypothetical protein